MKSGLLYILWTCGLVSATLGPSDKPKTVKKPATPKVLEIHGPQPIPVLERGLIRADPKISDIIINHDSYHKNTDVRFFNGTVLGYVTPWNSHGYDIAKLFAPKFQFISPVWLQIKKIKKEEYEILGLHDVDYAWMKTVKNSGSSIKTKIVPRLLFEGWSANDYTELLTGSKDERIALAKLLKKTCKTWKFDGFVIEFLYQMPGTIKLGETTDFLRFLGLSMAESLLELILVLPPTSGTPNDNDLTALFNDLYNYVTAFSLMTYDFSSQQRPGPNAPIEWIRRCVTNLVADDDDKEIRQKIWIGLNFYGNLYTPSGGGPIVGPEYIEFLRNNKGIMKFDDISVEHFVDAHTAEGRKMVFYPTIYSIQRRISLAVELGCGIAIWELGQGLDYFYDLF